MDRSSLPKGERGSFEAEAGRSHTLPSRYYHNADIHRHELRNIFQRSWCYLGHVNQLPENGDYRVDRIADQCVFLIRVDSTTVKAYFNACQHRGHQLLDGHGNTGKRIVCPYHAWTYALDGALVNAPHTGRVEGFDPSEFGLREIRLASCAGLLFGNLAYAAPAFDDEYAGLEETLTGALPDLAGFTTAERIDYDIAANWKVVVDNFSEGYHIPVAHKRLSGILDNNTTQRAVIEPRFAYFHSLAKAGNEELGLEGGEPYRSWTLWPNTCILALPGCDNLVVLRMAPDGPTRCLERAEILAPGETRDSRLDAILELFAENFNREDIALVENVQRGLQSLGYDQGRYVVDADESWYTESGLHRFHLQVLDALAED